MLAADGAGEPLLVLAGGSNVVVADDGFPGVVVHIATRGIDRREEEGKVLLTVQAGEPWDPFVAHCVEHGLAGVEALSGIPGSVGATPIQNVGAYGQEVSETIDSVLVLDRERKVVQLLDARAAEFSYRSSAFKRTPGRWVVLAVTFALDADPLSRPVRYAELARALGVEVGERAPLAAVREAVLDLRRRKGMVVDDGDPDSVSAGLVLHEPVLSARSSSSELVARVREKLGPDATPAELARARRPREDLGGLAHRARGLRQGPRRSRHDRDLGQAHARADQPRRGHDRAARRAGARGRRRRAARVRRRPRARAGLRRARLGSSRLTARVE